MGSVGGEEAGVWAGGKRERVRGRVMLLRWPGGSEVRVLLPLLDGCLLPSSASCCCRHAPRTVRGCAIYHLF